MRVGNFVGNTIEKAAVLPISIPPRKKYLVYSLFTRGEANAFPNGEVIQKKFPILHRLPKVGRKKSVADFQRPQALEQNQINVFPGSAGENILLSPLRANSPAASGRGVCAQGAATPNF